MQTVVQHGSGAQQGLGAHLFLRQRSNCASAELANKNMLNTISEQITRFISGSPISESDQDGKETAMKVLFELAAVNETGKTILSGETLAISWFD